MDSAICLRASSASPPASLVAPVALKPSAFEGQHLMTQAAAAAAAVEQQRFQQLYQIALAERLRLASGLTWPRPPSSLDNASCNMLNHPGINTPSNMIAAAAAVGHGYIYPWRFMDPRALYRVPEEPKPQHSYIGLIAMAILSSPDKKLVLSDIYSYILENYAYFRNRGPGWRNSIRHNLSLNDCFMKAGRSANGKGHYWAIHPANIDDFARGDFRRRRAQRRVRKHLGLQVDDDSSPEPPPTSPISVTPTDIQTPMSLTPNNLLTTRHHNFTRKRQFDVASLLAPDETPEDSILKTRRYDNESPRHVTPDTSERITSSPLGLKQEPNDGPEHISSTSDDPRGWHVVGWPQCHSWTILTPPQEEAELQRTRSESPSK